MGELAVGAVDLAPLLEQRQHLGGFLGQDGVNRGPARCLVGQATAGPAGVPAVGTPLGQPQRGACAAQAPAGPDGVVDQGQQPGLGDRVHPAWDSATQPQPPFPSTNVSLTASSLQASESRATSALACSSS